MGVAWRDRCVPANEATRLVDPGAHVFVGSACATPRTFVAVLEKPETAPSGVRLVHFLTDGIVPTLGGSRFTLFQHRTFFVGRDMAEIPPERVEYVPLSLTELPELLRSGRITIDVGVVQVTPPDDDGFCSLGHPAHHVYEPATPAAVSPPRPLPTGCTGLGIRVVKAVISVTEACETIPLAQNPADRRAREGASDAMAATRT